jgi:hypothetical protein
VQHHWHLSSINQPVVLVRSHGSFTFTSIANDGPVGKHVVHPCTPQYSSSARKVRDGKRNGTADEKKNETAGLGRWMWQDGPFSYLITQTMLAV